MHNATPEPSVIGERVSRLRRRRGLSQTAVATTLGVTQPYLSLLEAGKRAFDKRGLLEDLANVLGCSVVDLTGQPYLPGGRASAEALAILPEISLALYDATLDDVPDIPARSVRDLVDLVALANEHTAHSRYSEAGRGLGALLTELHVHAIRSRGATRRAALEALVETCAVACGIARSLGNADLAVAAARRGEDAASRLRDPALRGFAAMSSSTALSRLGARHRAKSVVSRALDALEHDVDPSAADTSVAEAWGMLHLSAAQMAAKDQRTDDAHTHLDSARELAVRTGERNRLWFAFGPANVTAWSLSVAVELGEGPELAERIVTAEVVASLPSADRRAALHFDLARAYAQAGGSRDVLAVHHLDQADWTAPQRLRHDPVAHDLLRVLAMRAPVPTRVLNSLTKRFAIV